MVLWWLLIIRATAYVEADGSVTHFEMPDFVPPTDPKDIPTKPHNPERVRLTLQMELRKYDNEWIEMEGLHLGQYLQLQDFSCEERLLYLADITAVLSEKVGEWHLNFTGTAGLWWLHTSDSQDFTWVWLIHYFFEKITSAVRSYFHKASVMSLDRPECFSSTLRESLAHATQGYLRLLKQQMSLLWNGFAFGVLGDVTNENAIDPLLEEEAALEGITSKTHAPAVNKTCNNTADSSCAAAGGGSTFVNPHGNLIFSHMFTGTINEFLKKHAIELHQTIAAELEKGNVSENLRPHHQDEEGHFVYFEALRREVFQQWAVDRGLLRGFLKLIDLGGSVTLGDFGAGGGHYSKWLNDTGLVRAFAFDGTPNIDRISPGVAFLNLNEPKMTLWRTFDWVLCLEVAEHIPAKHTATMLQNVARHAEAGIIMSWSEDMEGIGHVNCMKEADWHSVVENTIPFRVDKNATTLLRSLCTIDYIGRSATVFIRV